MSANGKRLDVIVDDCKYTDQRTGMEVLGGLTVWADPGMMNIILSVEGVTKVYDVDGPTQYHVFLDKRYDREYIKREIEAAILCGGLK